MTKKISAFLLICMLAVLGMCIFPPWEYRRGPIGYFPIWSPPAIPSCSIDSERLWVQVVVACLLTAIGYLASNLVSPKQLKSKVGESLEPIAAALDKRRALITALLVGLLAISTALVPIYFLKKYDEERKTKIALEQKAALELKLKEEEEKQAKIAALVARDEKAKLERLQRLLAKPVKWPIVLKERQLRGVATTTWQAGVMTIGLELNARPELIELADARGEELHIFFTNKKGIQTVSVLVLPGSLVVQKDSRGAWSRLVMHPATVGISAAEYGELKGIRVIYNAYGL